MTVVKMFQIIQDMYKHLSDAVVKFNCQSYLVVSIQNYVGFCDHTPTSCKQANR